MGGDMKKIQTVGNYFVEVWKAVGMEGLNEKVPSLPPPIS
jgi:tyrosyl-tRNA synthetase